jgi:hypothetical protein
MSQLTLVGTVPVESAMNSAGRWQAGLILGVDLVQLHKPSFWKKLLSSLSSYTKGTPHV